MKPKYLPTSPVEDERRERLFQWLRDRSSRECTGARFDLIERRDPNGPYGFDPLGVTRGILWTALAAVGIWGFLFWVIARP